MMFPKILVILFVSSSLLWTTTIQQSTDSSNLTEEVTTGASTEEFTQFTVDETSAAEAVTFSEEEETSGTAGGEEVTSGTTGDNLTEETGSPTGENLAQETASVPSSGVEAEASGESMARDKKSALETGDNNNNASTETGISFITEQNNNSNITEGPTSSTVQTGGGNKCGDQASTPPVQNITMTTEEPPSATTAKIYHKSLKCYVCDDRNNTGTPRPVEAPCQYHDKLSKDIPVKRCQKHHKGCYNGRFFMKGYTMDSPDPKYWMVKKCVEKPRIEDVYRDGERPDWEICIRDDQLFTPKNDNVSTVAPEVTTATTTTTTTTIAPGAVVLADEEPRSGRDKEDEKSVIDEGQNYTVLDMDYICMCRKSKCNNGIRLTVSPRVISGGVAIGGMILLSKILRTI